MTPAISRRSPRGIQPRAGFSLEGLEGRTLFASYAANNVPELIADINAANASAGADTITLAAGVTFSLTAVDNTTNGATGLPRIAAGGGSLTILGNSDTIERSPAEGTPAFRLVDVAAGASLTLKNLTLQGGVAAGVGLVSTPGGITAGPGQGGAIRNDGALSLDAVTIRNSTAQGALGSHFFFQQAPGGSAMGGGIYSSGLLMLSGCTIRNNFAIGGDGAIGFIPIEPQPVSGGRGGNACGGGAYIAGGTATVSGSSLSANTCIGGVGGAQGDGRYAGSGGDGLGGGLFAAAGSPELRNVTVIANRVQGGASGAGRKTKALGQPGKGIGGGLYFDAAASAGLDNFTRKHVTGNAASTKKPDIFGDYVLIV